MEVWVNSDGTRNRENRPYIEQEETGRSVYPYDPNGSGFHYGLYQTAQPTCGRWVDVYSQYPGRERSTKSVDRHGIVRNYH